MTTPPLAFLGALRPAFVAHLADRLNDQICRETANLAATRDIVAPGKTHSVMLFLAGNGSATLAEIARTDGQSHQLLAARLAPLEKLKLIERFDDPQDGRRRPYRLTARGRADVVRIEAFIGQVAAAMSDLFDEIDADLIAVLEQAIERLHRRPLTARLREAERLHA